MMECSSSRYRGRPPKEKKAQPRHGRRHSSREESATCGANKTTKESMQPRNGFPVAARPGKRATPQKQDDDDDVAHPPRCRDSPPCAQTLRCTGSRVGVRTRSKHAPRCGAAPQCINLPSVHYPGKIVASLSHPAEPRRPLDPGRSCLDASRKPALCKRKLRPAGPGKRADLHRGAAPKPRRRTDLA